MHAEHTVEIAAPPADVWAVTVDVAAWPAWVPAVREVRLRGPLGVGATATVVQATGDAATWTVTAFDPARRFAWATRVRGVRVEASHRLEALGAGRTRHTARVEAFGAAGRVAWPLVRGRVAHALAEENAARRARCEARQEVQSKA